MMRYLYGAAVVAALAQPALAFDRMLRSDCQVTVEKIIALAEGEDALTRTRNVAILDAVQVNPQGWCQIRTRNRAGLEDWEFDTLEWRAEGITRWTRDDMAPLALQVRIEGLDPDIMQGSAWTNRPDLTLDATLRQEPDAGMLILERAELSNSTGDMLVASGVFDRVFLSSPSMIQVSAGSIAFKAGLIAMTLEGTHANPFGLNGAFEMTGSAQDQRDAAERAVSVLPDTLVDDASRTEMVGFAGALPNPVGTLEVSMSSERGYGLMQAVAAIAQEFTSLMEDEAQSAQSTILFDGLSLSANWIPAAASGD